MTEQLTTALRSATRDTGTHEVLAHGALSCEGRRPPSGERPLRLVSAAPHNEGAGRRVPSRRGGAHWPPADMPFRSALPRGRPASPTGRVRQQVASRLCGGSVPANWPGSQSRGVPGLAPRPPVGGLEPPPSRRSGPADLPSCPPLARGAHAAPRGLEAEGVSNGTRGPAPHRGAQLGSGPERLPHAAPAARASCPLGVLAGRALVPRAAASNGPAAAPPAVGAVRPQF